MTKQFTLRNAALVAALAAVGATAWAATEYILPHQHDPIVSENMLITEPPIDPYTNEPMAAEPVIVQESLTPNETVVVTTTETTVTSTPVPPITIEERRLSTDERIQLEVMDKLAAATNISGKIGVESSDAVVTLSGHVLSGAQVDRAGRYAREVEGVKYVQNDLRKQLGRW